MSGARLVHTAIPALTVVLCSILAWRLIDWAVRGPNTYALKATRGGSTVERGVAYLEGFAWSESRGVALLVAPVLALVWRWLSRRPKPLPYLTMVAVPYLWIFLASLGTTQLRRLRDVRGRP